MAARFVLLHDDNIATGVSRSSSLLERTNLPAGQGAAAMCDLDQRRVRVGPEEVDDPDSARRRPHRVSIDLLGQEVRREHTRRSCRHFGEHPVELDGSQSHRGDGSDAARIGNRDRQRRG